MRHFTKNEAGGGVRVTNATNYQRLAAECLLLAQTASDQVNRFALLQMAATWLKLAEQELTTSARQTEAQDLD
jgi:hypothetical protein